MELFVASFLDAAAWTIVILNVSKAFLLRACLRVPEDLVHMCSKNRPYDLGFCKG